MALRCHRAPITVDLLSAGLPAGGLPAASPTEGSAGSVATAARAPHCPPAVHSCSSCSLPSAQPPSCCKHLGCSPDCGALCVGCVWLPAPEWGSPAWEQGPCSAGVPAEAGCTSGTGCCCWALPGLAPESPSHSSSASNKTVSAAALASLAWRCLSIAASALRLCLWRASCRAASAAAASAASSCSTLSAALAFAAAFA